MKITLRSVIAASGLEGAKVTLDIEGRGNRVLEVGDVLNLVPAHPDQVCVMQLLLNEYRSLVTRHAELQTNHMELLDSVAAYVLK